MISTSRSKAFGHSVVFGALLSATLLVVSGCSTPNSPAEQSSESENSPQSVTLIVHDTFPEDEFAEAASAATGYDVQVITAGDGGELTNQLVLTKGAPLADAFFGVDHIFASRLIEHDVVEPYQPSTLPARASEYTVDEQGSLTPIDLGATCMNIDPQWFADHNIAPPATYEDLADAQYRDLTVLLDPTSSSTGASFLVGTVAKFGEEGYLTYWQSLIDNGARIEQNWSDAYYTHFTASSSDGTRPIVLSYSSSPGYTVTEDGTSSTTVALLDTCSSQVEYAGVLAGASNPQGAREVIDFMLSREFQDTIADTMYVYPIDDEAMIPSDWAEFAPLPDSPNDLSLIEIGNKRDTWLKDLSEAIGL